MSGANSIKKRIYCRKQHTCVCSPTKRHNYSFCGNEQTLDRVFRCEKCGAFLGLQWSRWDSKADKWIETSWAANNDCLQAREIPNGRFEEKRGIDM